uniref:Uncharacterized protein n=1 Tax=Anguilla anguilla TaxID=7936 RepID=A0A0E9QZ87_ANGAN
MLYRFPFPYILFFPRLWPPPRLWCSEDRSAITPPRLCGVIPNNTITKVRL